MALVKGTTAGFVSSRPSGDPTGEFGVDCGNAALACLDTTSAGITKITEIGCYIGSATATTTLDFGIYTKYYDLPWTLVGHGTVAKGTTAGWKYVTVNITVSASTDYFIGVVSTDEAICNVDTQSTIGTGAYFTSGTTLPNESPDWREVSWGMYGVYAIESSGTSGTNMKINIGDDWKDIASMQINIGDVWKDVTAVQINIGDAWKDVF